MSDEDAGFDWDSMRKASADLAEFVWTYHAALLAAGMSEETALPLVMAYQQMFLDNFRQ